MAKIGRRLFSSMVGSAPLAGAAVSQGKSEVVDDGVWIGNQSIRQTAPLPPSLEAYQIARDKYFSAKKLLNQRTIFTTGARPIDPNIEVLQSVSRQHKLWMMVDKEEQEAKETHSFMSKLVDKFGLESYFEGRDYL